MNTYSDKPQLNYSEKPALTCDSSTLSSREDRFRIDPVIHLKHIIAELQEQNASLRADLAFKTAQHERQLQAVKANQSELMAGVTNPNQGLNDQNLNLQKIIKAQEVEIEAIRDLLKSREKELRLGGMEVQQLQAEFDRVNQDKQSILCLFKKFQNRQVYQMVRDLSSCQQLLCSNINSLVEAEHKSAQQTFISQRDQSAQHSLTFRTVDLPETKVIEDIELELQSFKKNVLMNKHYKNKRYIMDSFILRLEGTVEVDKVLDMTHNICGKRIKKLKMVIVRLLGALQGVDKVRSDISKVAAQMQKMRKVMLQENEQMFQKAFQSMQRYQVNTQPKPKPQPRQATRRSKSKQL